jgi:hypothetical protein
LKSLRCLGQSDVKEARVWVNASSADRQRLEAAVLAGGGALSDPASANAIVWAADEPESARRYLAAGVEWVQLSAAGIEDWFAAGVIDADRTWTAAKGVYAAAIAEYVVTMLLAASRRLPELIGTRRWLPLEVETLAGKQSGTLEPVGSVAPPSTGFARSTRARSRSRDVVGSYRGQTSPVLHVIWSVYSRRAISS